MNQSLLLDVQGVVALAQAAGMFPNLCTIQEIPGTLDNLGAPVMTFSNVTGLVDIPCHASPVSESNIGVDERRLRDRVDEKPQLHVLLAGYYPQVLLNMRAVIDGNPWNVISSENDAFLSQTRLLVEAYTL